MITLINDIANFGRGKGDKDKGKRKLRANKVMYKGRVLSVNSPMKSDNPRHKYMVFARKNGKTKLIRYGDPNMQDYTQHKNKTRRTSYRARAKGILDKSGNPAYKNFFSRAYWSMKKW